MYQLALLLLLVSTCAAAGDRWHVVILPGADPTQPAVIAQIRALRSALTAVAPDGVEFYTDSLDELRFDDADLMAQFLALLQKKYERKRVDIVIGISDFALEFTKRYHDTIWPNVPILLTSIDESRVARLPPQFAYVPWHYDVDGTLALAEALQPHATRLVVVAGNGNFDAFTAQLAKDTAVARNTRHWSVDPWIGLPLRDLRQRLAALDPASTAVLYTAMYRDRDGRTFFPIEAVAPMASASHAPIYGWFPTYLGHGIAGGAVIDYEDNGRRVGELAAAILLGKVDAHGATLPKPRSRCIVDRAQLDRLDINANLIPADCEQINVSPSLWSQYRWAVVVTVAVLLLQALTIAALLWQRRKRYSAEQAAALRADELARAARIASAGELSASIAHEVGQPLGAILSNADAAGLILAQHKPEVGELQQILADVRRDAMRANQVVHRLRALLKKHPIEFVRLDLNTTVEETLVLLAPEARRRRIALEADLNRHCAEVVGDRVQLQQVLLNLAVNAMDAMENTVEPLRVLTIATRPAGGQVELTVADRGPGIRDDARSKLFDSFYTTKAHGMGLGLSIVRTIVASHDGKISVSPRGGGGSIFAVSLPSAPASSARAAPESSTAGPT